MNNTQAIGNALIAYGRLTSAVDQVFNCVDLGDGEPEININGMTHIHTSMSKICELYEMLYTLSVDTHTKIQSLHAKYMSKVSQIQNFISSAKTTDTLDAAWTLKTRRGTRVLPPPGFTHTIVPMPKPPEPPGAMPVGYYERSTNDNTSIIGIGNTNNTNNTNTINTNTNTIINTKQAKTSRIPVSVPPINNTQLVSVTPSIDLPARRVLSFNDVTTNGDLYYIDSCNHFAFRIAGVLFHGNVGAVYGAESEPTKIKDCKYGANCSRDSCTYYHDPMKSPTSSDVRNYISNSWVYLPSTSPLRNRKISRGYGAIQYLDADVNNVDAEDASRFFDQTTHDVLCSLILDRHRSHV